MSIGPKLPSLFLSMPHQCSYFADRQASTIFVDPQNPADAHVYNYLLKAGFRRSGELVYRPQCFDCADCVSVRIPVAQFRRRRSQRRITSRNADLEISIVPAGFIEEHFELYKKYQEGRHAESSMNDDNPEHYRDFLFNPLMNTQLVEFRLQQRLICVAVVDPVDDGLSAVYTFYDPEERKRGLGVNAILWQVEKARELNLDYVYLGYWIRNCSKMEYKTDYQPLEGYIGKRWQIIENF